MEVQRNHECRAGQVLSPPPLFRDLYNGGKGNTILKGCFKKQVGKCFALSLPVVNRSLPPAYLNAISSKLERKSGWSLHMQTTLSAQGFSACDAQANGDRSQGPAGRNEARQALFLPICCPLGPCLAGGSPSHPHSPLELPITFVHLPPSQPITCALVPSRGQTQLLRAPWHPGNGMRKLSSGFCVVLFLPELLQ